MSIGSKIATVRDTATIENIAEYPETGGFFEGYSAETQQSRWCIWL